MSEQKSILLCLKKDLEVITNDGNWKAKFKVCLLSHSFHMTLLIRMGSYSRKIPIVGSVLSFIFEYLIRVIYASDISCKAEFGEGLNIMHGHDIVIGSGAKVGKNNKIFNGVTLGNKNTESTKIEQPDLGNNVVLSTGVKVLGKVKIGDNSIVGANSVVTKDIPGNSIWAGVPAREIRKVTCD
ncbi:serine acetyltransferase [Pseudoalteromonas sp. MMG013]|uniref:serine O-acetyltransferase n=1 Tax=Pseudoalteromonas sp. MMG013 TaxID=2822687 RepID=UPI001B39AA18|nr:serine acetyltransferase [Pseudoalteromonas sp. MMG013]MBQ4860872.1 serine acetyltransferase [Pseudoalteromonas sp. MMG013]